MVQKKREQELGSLQAEAQLKLAMLWKQAYPEGECPSASTLCWLSLMILSGKLNLSGGSGDDDVSKLAADFNSTLDEIAKYDALAAKQSLSVEQQVEQQHCINHLIDIVTLLYQHAKSTKQSTKQ